MKTNQLCQIVAISWTAIQLLFPSGASMRAELQETSNGGWAAKLLDEQGNVITQRDCSAVPLLWQDVAADMACEQA